jgi:hypothetical protein
MQDGRGGDVGDLHLVKAHQPRVPKQPLWRSCIWCFLQYKINWPQSSVMWWQLGICNGLE